VSVYGTITSGTGNKAFLGTPYSQFSHLAAEYWIRLAANTTCTTDRRMTYWNASLAAFNAPKMVQEY
jgi:hypothetical protein